MNLIPRTKKPSYGKQTEPRIITQLVCEFQVFRAHYI